MTLKQFSTEVTNRYLYGLMLKSIVDELGGDAPVIDINTVNRVMDEVKAMDEAIRARLRTNPGYARTTDPDSDCP